MKLKIFLILTSTALLGLGCQAVDHAVVPAPGQVACTQEAKLCPDGSAVGRTGPNCEFAACPTVNTTTNGSIGVVSPPEPFKFASFTKFGITVKPLEVLQDSRCPAGAKCIWAGTVELKVNLAGLGSSQDVVLTLGKPVTFNNYQVTLSSVNPVREIGQSLVAADSKFVFDIIAATEMPTSTLSSGVEGVVTLGPTCPVMRNPPDPNCADKFYQTTINVVSNAQGASTQVATASSDAAGKFIIILQPGSYTLEAVGGQMLPRCAPVDVVVAAGAISEANISCDTGIR